MIKTKFEKFDVTSLREEEEAMREDYLKKNKLSLYYEYYRLKAELGCSYLSNNQFESVYNLNWVH